MARIKQGVFSWEDVLAQRYQSECTIVEVLCVPDENLPHCRGSPTVLLQRNTWTNIRVILRTRQAISPLPSSHVLADELSLPRNHSPNVDYCRASRPSFGS